MDAIDANHFPALIRLTYRVLALRALVYLALLAAVGLFSWAMALGTTQAVVTAIAFTVCVFLPILYRHQQKETPHVE